MRQHQKKNKYLLYTIMLSIDFCYAKNVKWKPGKEDAMRFPLDRTLQIDKKNPTDTTLQNDRRFPIDKPLKNDRNIPINEPLQNDRTTRFDKPMPNPRRTRFDKPMPNDGRIPIDELLQNHRRIPSYDTTETDGLMQEDRIKKINAILEQDQKSHNALTNNFARLLQNEYFQENKRVESRRGMQNDGNIQHDLKVNNTKQNQHEQNIKNLRKIEGNGMFAFTPQPPPPILRAPPKKKAQTQTPKRVLHKRVEKKGPPVDPPVSWSGMLGMENLWLTFEGISRWQPTDAEEMIIRMCYCIATTHITALQDYKKYYSLRYMYQNNIQFEVGYLVSEIISKYTKMLEIYNMAVDYFYTNKNKPYMPSQYMMYMYTNVLEMGTVISHLCDMLTEMEDKYQFIPVPESGFTDYHEILMAKSKNDPEAAMAREAMKYDRIMAKIRNRKNKPKKKQKKSAKNVNLDTRPSTPPRRHPHKYWNIRYGWSIEYEW